MFLGIYNSIRTKNGEQMDLKLGGIVSKAENGKSLSLLKDERGLGNIKRIEVVVCEHPGLSIRKRSHV